MLPWERNASVEGKTTVDVQNVYFVQAVNIPETVYILRSAEREYVLRARSIYRNGGLGLVGWVTFSAFPNTVIVSLYSTAEAKDQNGTAKKETSTKSKQQSAN